MKTCPFCAEDIQDAAIVCKHCNRDLVAGASSVHHSQVDAIAQRATKAGVKMLVKIALGVAAVAVLVVFGLGVLGEIVDPSPPPMSDSQREHVLRSTIVDAGKECREVTKVVRLRLDDRTGDSVWTATCFQGPTYDVLLRSNGEARVVLQK